jgi:hypothetical protein
VILVRLGSICVGEPADSNLRQYLRALADELKDSRSRSILYGSIVRWADISGLF